MDETSYVAGSRAAWLSVLQLALKYLGYDDPEANAARWVSEREQAVTALRRVCAAHGDNDWRDTLHLADVVENHLTRHLEGRHNG